MFQLSGQEVGDQAGAVLDEAERGRLVSTAGDSDCPTLAQARTGLIRCCWMDILDRGEF
jgi:hypothetical protein